MSDDSTRAKEVRDMHGVVCWIKQGLGSTRFGKWLFITVVAAHFVLYWLAGILLVVLERPPGLPYWMLGTDFQIAYDLGLVLLENPAHFYDLYAPFIYNPALALYIFIWALIFGTTTPPTEMLVVMVWYNLTLFFWNVGTAWFLFKILKQPRVQELLGSSVFKNPYLIPALYMVLPLHYLEYFVGQVNAPSCFFILVALYYHVKEKEHLFYLFMSIAVIFKIIPAFFLVFLLLSQAGLKRFIKNVGWVLVPQSPAILLVLAFPQLSFEIVNQLLFTVGEFSTSPLHHFGNLITYLKGYHDVSTTLTVILLAVILVPINLFILRTRSRSMTMIDKLCLLGLLFINLSPILYVVHLKIMLGIVLLWLVTKNGLPFKRYTPLKVLVAIPFLSLMSWFVFPYYFIVFLLALVYLDVAIMTGTSVKEKEPSLFSL